MCLCGQGGIVRVFENASESLRCGQRRRSPPLLFRHINKFLISFRAVVVDVERLATANHGRLDVQQIRVRLHDRMCLAKLDFRGR